MIEQMLAFLEAHPISGARIHDVRLAATMVENGVSKIVTYDQGLFSQLPGIEVLDPSEFLQDQIRKEDRVREIEGDEDQT